MSKFEDDDFFEEELPDQNPLLDTIEDSELSDSDSTFDFTGESSEDGLEIDKDEDIIVPIKPKKQKLKPKDKPYYLEPELFHAALKEYIVMRTINPETIISNKLGRMIVKIVEGVFSKNNFRNYFNGWDVEMKSRAYEHICKYAHKFNILYCETTEFFLKWMFREHEEKLKRWFEFTFPHITYDDFRLSLKDVKVQSFKKKSEKEVLGEEDLPKYKKAIDILALKKVYWEDNMEMNEKEFMEYFFTNYENEDLRTKFDEYKKRNAFNYFTKIAFMAGKHTIKVENKKNDVTLKLDEAIYYRTSDEDDDCGENDNRFTKFNEVSIDWGGESF